MWSTNKGANHFSSFSISHLNHKNIMPEKKLPVGTKHNHLRINIFFREETLRAIDVKDHCFKCNAPNQSIFNTIVQLHPWQCHHAEKYKGI